MSTFANIDRCQNLIKNWWILLILGTSFITVGILVFINPEKVFLTFLVYSEL